MIKFYRKDDGSLTIKDYEAQFAPHVLVDDDASVCPVCGLTWRPDYDSPCLCKDEVDFFNDNIDFNAKEVFDLLQPMICGAYDLGINPLPALRGIFGENSKISYWNGDCFGALRDCPMSDVISGKVMVLVSKDGHCRFWE